VAEGERYWFEDVPEEGRYWALVQWGTPQSRADEPEPDFTEEVFSNDLEAVEEDQEVIRRQHAVGFAPGAIELELIQTDPDEYALVLYTSREAAEEELRAIEERDPEEYLRLVDVYGQDQTDQAYSNTPPYRVVWTTPELLLEKLKELELAALEKYGPPFEQVVVDDQRLDRWSFTQQLERRVEEDDS
jgi:hypothetical protein